MIRHRFGEPTRAETSTSGRERPRREIGRTADATLPSKSLAIGRFAGDGREEWNIAANMPSIIINYCPALATNRSGERYTGTGAARSENRARPPEEMKYKPAELFIARFRVYGHAARGNGGAAPRCLTTSRRRCERRPFESPFLHGTPASASPFPSLFRSQRVMGAPRMNDPDNESHSGR